MPAFDDLDELITDARRQVRISINSDPMSIVAEEIPSSGLWRAFFRFGGRIDMCSAPQSGPGAAMRDLHKRTRKGGG